jgi:hypothetical protein
LRLLTTTVAVAFLSTVCVVEPELATKRASPLESAVMLLVPAGRVEVVRVATPSASRASGPDEVATPLTVKVTVPLGTPLARFGLTVAVDGTLCPTKDGFGAFSRTVVEPGFGTVTVTG